MEEKKSSQQPTDVVTKLTEKAQKQADSDIQEDPDLNLQPNPGADLDEGELARLENKDE
jgi:hypothetical protein